VEVVIVYSRAKKRKKEGNKKKAVGVN